MTLRIVVPGIAQPCGSKRPVPGGKYTRLIDTNPNARAWRDRVVYAVRDVLNGAAPMQGPLRLFVRCGLPRPKYHYGKKGLKPSAPSAPDKRPDHDKLMRNVSDALTEAGAWVDDGQVADSRIVKVYAEQPETVIEVEKIGSL